MANGTLAVSQLEILSQSGTGIVTIVPPATNTNRTLTLPDATGTVATAQSTLAQFNASGSAPVYACRAWVNFNGAGTVAIRASGNVSSITDNGTGDYTVNFATAMQDANYAVNLTSGGSTARSTANAPGGGGSLATTYCQVVGFIDSTSLFQDQPFMSVSIFR